MAQRSSMKGFYEAKFKTNKIMGWGTGFKSDIYISRVDVKNKHPDLDWAEIAARKIYAEIFEDKKQ